MRSKQKSREELAWLMAVGGVVLVLAGCATSDVDPAQARAKTGYVDFHAQPPGQFTWQVSRFDAATKDFQQIYSSFDPPQAGIVRLALTPGQYHFRLELLNLLTTGPVDVEVGVEDGKVTPVRLTVARKGSGDVETVETNVGGTLYGRYGRNTKISDDAEAQYKVSGAVEESVSYRVKSGMPYAQLGNQ